NGYGAQHHLEDWCTVGGLRCHARNDDGHWAWFRCVAGTKGFANTSDSGTAYRMIKLGEEIVTTRPSTSTHVLIIDDDERLNKLLTEYLTRFGFSVRAVSHSDAGLRALKTNPPDILVLDIMLPDMDGLSVCRKVRESSRIPIIMLTARGDVADRI